MIERREKKREVATGSLHFCLSDPKINPDTHESFPEMGLILNTSKSGLGFITTCPLEAGQVIAINCPVISDKPELGTVRWCSKFAKDIWRVGLQRNTTGVSPS